MFCHHSDIWPGAANGKQIWELQGPKQEIGNYKYKHTYKDKKYTNINMKINIWPGAANGKQIWELQCRKQELLITNINSDTKNKK